MEKKEEIKLEKARKTSIKEASAYSLSDGFGFKFVSPYALSLGANNTQIGLISSLPGLLANFSQLFSLKLIEKVPRKKIVFWGVLFQAISWLLILVPGILYFIIGASSIYSSNLLIIIYSMLVVFGAFPGPAWSSWMKDIVGKNIGSYFGKRGKIAGSISLISMLIAGFILDYFKHTYLFAGFIILFFIAFIGRSISTYMFTKQYEPKLKLEKGYYFTFPQFLKRITKSNFGKFTIFVSLITLASAIASPFFVVYSLKNLGFSYTQWTAIVVINVLLTLIFSPIWGRFSDRYGSLKTMRITGLLICITPLTWLISPFFSNSNNLFIYILLIEGFAGLVWAGFNLSAGNFIYEAVTRERMALCASYYGIINSIGAFIGATLGGIIASTNINIFLGNSILLVIFTSAIFRLIVYTIGINKIKEVREVERLDKHKAKTEMKNLGRNLFSEALGIFDFRFFWQKSKTS